MAGGRVDGRQDTTGCLTQIIAAAPYQQHTSTLRPTNPNTCTITYTCVRQAQALIVEFRPGDATIPAARRRAHITLSPLSSLHVTDRPMLSLLLDQSTRVAVA